MDDNKYEDIINLPHHVSSTRPRMSNQDRAAQFAPFAALTGYGDKIIETARLTDSVTELDDDRKAAIDMKLQLIRDNIKDMPLVTFTYFEKDERKDGGAYLDITGRVKKINENESLIVFEDGESIGIDSIFNVSGELFKASRF